MLFVDIDIIDSWISAFKEESPSFWRNERARVFWVESGAYKAEMCDKILSFSQTLNRSHGDQPCTVQFWKKRKFELWFYTFDSYNHLNIAPKIIGWKLRNIWRIFSNLKVWTRQKQSILWIYPYFEYFLFFINWSILFYCLGKYSVLNSLVLHQCV